MLPGSEDTIAAIATAPGRGSLAVVRISGPEAHRIARDLLHPWFADPRRVYQAALHDPLAGNLVDRPLVTVFEAPRSYTGEPVVELSLHGGITVPVLALRAVLRAGAREALPGEFTRRAVSNGKIDLLQAEAIADLVDAPTEAMHDLAIGQLEGRLSKRLSDLREHVIELEALIAYDIDFPEEDQGEVSRSEVENAAERLLKALDSLLATSAAAEVVRHGAPVVIAGIPNAGKSSLFNTLIGATRAIVSAYPGTTRDALEAMIQVGRWPVRLVDTAGLREAGDPVERMGVEVAEQHLDEAAVVLACGESFESLATAVEWIERRTRAPLIRLRTKVDLDPGTPTTKSLAGSGADAGAPGSEILAVSTVTGAGLEQLVRCIEQVISTQNGPPPSGAVLLSRERHRNAVSYAREEINSFAELWRSGAIPAPVAAVHLRAAGGALGELIGDVSSESILDRVFSEFCVGK